MRLTECFIALQPTLFTKSMNDALCSFRALGLRIVDDSRSITAAMKAGGNPTGCSAREPCRFGKMVDERLLPALGNGKDIDLRDDAAVRFDDRHNSVPPEMRRDCADRSTCVECGNPRRQAVDAIAPMACRGFAGLANGASRREGTGLTGCQSWSFST